MKYLLPLGLYTCSFFVFSSSIYYWNCTTYVTHFYFDDLMRKLKYLVFLLLDH